MSDDLLDTVLSTVICIILWCVIWPYFLAMPGCKFVLSILGVSVLILIADNLSFFYPIPGVVDCLVLEWWTAWRSSFRSRAYDTWRASVPTSNLLRKLRPVSRATEPDHLGLIVQVSLLIVEMLAALVVRAALALFGVIRSAWTRLRHTGAHQELYSRIASHSMSFEEDAAKVRSIDGDSRNDWLRGPTWGFPPDTGDALNAYVFYSNRLRLLPLSEIRAIIQAAAYLHHIRRRWRFLDQHDPLTSRMLRLAGPIEQVYALMQILAKAQSSLAFNAAINQPSWSSSPSPTTDFVPLFLSTLSHIYKLWIISYTGRFLQHDLISQPALAQLEHFVELAEPVAELLEREGAWLQKALDLALADDLARREAVVGQERLYAAVVDLALLKHREREG